MHLRWLAILLCLLVGAARAELSPGARAALTEVVQDVKMRAPLLLAQKFGDLRSVLRMTRVTRAMLALLPDYDLAWVAQFEALEAGVELQAGTPSRAVDKLERLLRKLDQRSDEATRKLKWGIRLSLVIAGVRSSQPELVKRNLSPLQQDTVDIPSPYLFLMETCAAQAALQRNPDLPTSELLEAHHRALMHLQAVKPEQLAEGGLRLTLEGLAFWQATLRERGERIEQVRPGVADALQPQLQWLSSIGSALTDRGDLISLEWRLAFNFYVLEEALGHLRADRVGRARSLLERLSLQEPEDRAVFASADSQVAGAALPAFIAPLTAKLEPHKREFAKAGLDWRAEDLLFHVEQGYLALYFDELHQAWIQLLMREGAPLVAFQEHLELARQAQARALVGGGYRGDRDLAELELEYLERLRPPGWRARGREVASAYLARARKYGYRPGVVSATLALARLQDDPRRAMAELRKALAGAAAWMAETGTTSRFQASYELLATLEAQSQDPAQALRTLAQARQVQTRSEASGAPALAGLRDLQRKAQSLEQEVAATRSLGLAGGRSVELQRQNRSEYYRELERLRKENPAYDSVLTVRPLTLEQIQPLIPKDACVLQYLPGPDALHVFVLTRKSLRLRTVPVPSADLEAWVRAFRTQVRARDDAVRTSSARLYGALIQPVEKDLEGCKILAVVPSGFLYHIPFNALGRPGPEGFRWLIERYQVATLAKLTDLHRVTQRKVASGRKLTALGDPDGSLPSAKTEAAELGQVFPGADVFLGGEASAGRLRALRNDTDYLHLATHGTMNARDPESSYLVVAGDDTAGQFRLFEVYNLRLQGTRLVTLSACQTAMSVRDGRFTPSLAEAFSIAGGRTVLASLWSVSDASTGQFMKLFYSEVIAGRPLGEALQEAQQRMLQEPRWSHPFYWAPFILIGDWR